MKPSATTASKGDAPARTVARRRVGRTASRWSDAALAEWRRYREPADPGARLTSAAQALSVLLPKLGLGDAMDEQAVRRAWSGMVGHFIAAQSLPERLRGGVLYVRVLQSSVRFELERTWKEKITRRLAAEFGADKIREVKFFC